MNTFKQLKQVLQADMKTDEYAEIVDYFKQKLVCRAVSGRYYYFDYSGDLLGTHVRIKDGRLQGFADLNEITL